MKQKQPFSYYLRETLRDFGHGLQRVFLQQKPPLPRPLRVLRTVAGALTLTFLCIAAGLWLLFVLTPDEWLWMAWGVDLPRLFWGFGFAAIPCALLYSLLRLRWWWTRVLSVLLAAYIFLAGLAGWALSLPEDYQTILSPAGTREAVVVSRSERLLGKTVYAIYIRENPFLLRQVHAYEKGGGMYWQGEDTLVVYWSGGSEEIHLSDAAS